MGRPLAKRFFGNLNLGTTSLFTTADAGLGGQSVASLGSVTGGTYTAGAPTYTFPVPLEAGLGGVRATGTPTWQPVAGQITIGGTQTQAYSASDVITQATTGVNYTPTLTTYASLTLASATAISANAITLSATTTMVKGTSFLFPAGVTGVTGLTPGTTYYVAATVTTSATVTLAATPTGSVLTISGTPAGTLTGVTVGAELASIASVVYRVSPSSPSDTINTTALATTASVSAGAGLTLAVAQWAVAGGRITQAGNGYVSSSTAALPITASTAGAGLTLGTVTSGTSGNFSFATAQTAGTFWVGQVITVSGTIGGTTWTGYTTGNNYIVSATNGTSTITLVALTSTTGLPTTAQVTSAGTTTGLTFTTAGTLTLSSVNGLVATGQKFVTTGTGGSSTVGAGTYHIIAVNSATKQISIAANYANFFTSTPVSITTDAGPIASTTGVGSQHLVISISGGTGSGGAISAVLSSTSTYIIASAFLPTGLKEYSDADVVAQKGSRRYKVETPDGTDVCLLTSTTRLTAGFMTIGATDSVGNTYFVTKLTKNNVTLQRNVQASGQTFQFANGATAKWMNNSANTILTTAVANVSVVVDQA